MCPRTTLKKPIVLSMSQGNPIFPKCFTNLHQHLPPLQCQLECNCKIWFLGNYQCTLGIWLSVYGCFLGRMETLITYCILLSMLEIASINHPNQDCDCASVHSVLESQESLANRCIKNISNSFFVVCRDDGIIFNN